MADKRPPEEQNEQEKNAKKKETESHSALLKKWIAERVTKFLSTSEWKDAMNRGKDFFVQKFLKSRESSDADAVEAYKVLIGKKPDDDLNIKDLADVQINYEDTFERYIAGAEKSQFTELQEKAVTHTFLDKMGKEIAGAHFAAPQRDAWKQYVASKKWTITNREDLQRALKEFFLKAGTILTADQKKRLNKVSIEFRDVADHMTVEAGFPQELADNLNKKQIIVANTDAEDMVKRFLRTYAESEVAPAFQRYQEKKQEITSIYKVPGFQRVLEWYDLSVDNLKKEDKKFGEIYDDESVSADKKFEAQQKAMISLIGRKDKQLSDLVENLFANQFNLARLSKENQQAYVTRFQEMWSNSKEMKTFDDLFAKMGTDVSDRKDLMKQIFDLSKNELQMKGKDGKIYTIPLQKKVIDRSWSGESMSETLAHELPIAFLLTPGKGIDEEYVQKLTKVAEKNFTLKDANGKEIDVYPGHLVEIATADGKKQVGYIYKDPDGNVMLSAEPWSAKRVTVDAEKMKTATARVVEPTYVLKTEDVPVLLSNMALLREVAARPEEKNREVIQEKTNEIVEETVKDKFDGEKVIQAPTDSEIIDLEWESQEVIDEMDEKRKKELKALIEKRGRETTARIAKIEKSLKDQDSLIQSLNNELKVTNAKAPLQKEQQARLQDNLRQAKQERDRLIDEKEDLAKKLLTYQQTQKKLQESDKRKLDQERAAEKETQKTDNKEGQKENEVDAKNANTVQEEVESNESFLHAWWEFNGDKTLSEPIAGKSCLMILLPDASSAVGGGWGVRVRLDVTGYNSDTNSMNVTWHGTEGKLINTGGSSLEGRKSTIHGAAGLKELKHAVSKVYKFKKYSTISQWGIDLKGGVSASDDDSPADKNFHFDKKYEGRRKHLKDDIDFSSMIHQQTKKPIKYFGKKVGDERVWYEVDQRGGSVKLKEIQQKDKEDKNNKDLETTYEREMPINDFMMFAMEKDLRGYTQEDVDDANGGNEYPQNKDMKYIFDTVEPISQPKAAFGTGLFGLTWGNIQGLKGSFDLVTKWMKTFFDEKAKKWKETVENAMLSSARFKKLEKLPIVGDAFDDIRWGIESKNDTEKKKKINEYKDEVETKKDSSSNGGSNFVKAGLENDALTRKNRKKAAGYYLYALEKGGNPYFRSLKEFAGTGWRVRKILGAAHQDKYLAYIKNVESELKKNPGSKELNNDLSMGELGYMQKIWGEGDKTGVQADLKAVFGNRFFTGGLGQAQYGMWYQQSKIDETVKNEGAKPFHQLFKDSWTGWYEGFRVNDVLWVLKLLSEKVGTNEDYYYKWVGSMMMPLMNGQYRTDMSPSYKAIFQQLAKKNALPFAGYITEGNGTEKMEELLDIFSDGSLSEAMKGKTSTIDRTKAFKAWWENPSGQARKALDKLQNPKELFAMKKKLEGETKDQTKLNQFNTLSDYINKKYNDDDRSGVNEQIDGESIIYQKNIFSAPSGFVKDQMLSFSNGQFKGKAEKSGPELWNALKAKINEISAIPEDEMSPDFFEFVLKRYFAMFSTKYTGTQKKNFVAALRHPQVPEAFRFNVRWIFDKGFWGESMPSEAQDTLIVFEKLFEKYAKAGIIKRNPALLEDVFDDRRMVDYYLNAKEEEVMTAANNYKQEQAMIKKQIAAGRFTSNDMDDNDPFSFLRAA